MPGPQDLKAEKKTCAHEEVSELRKGKTGSQCIEAPWRPDENLPAAIGGKNKKASAELRPGEITPLSAYLSDVALRLATFQIVFVNEISLPGGRTRMEPLNIRFKQGALFNDAKHYAPAKL
jgi:hypothetical protein